MKRIEHQKFDGERALYGERELHLMHCAFDGPADGESALKECTGIRAEDCYCNLRYPFWHDRDLHISGTELTPLCRAALWYSERVRIEGSRLHGIKALRECSDVAMADCDIRSAEFGWSVRGIEMRRCTAESEYFMMRAEDMRFVDVRLRGKYSFQYVQNATFEDCELDTKDAFWHAKNVTVRNSVVRGEYLAWYSDSLTLVNCKIIGTQPFCYCTNLRLIDCEMVDADLCFEKSEVSATLTAPVQSVKNPLCGTIFAPAVGQVILDDPHARGQVVLWSEMAARTGAGSVLDERKEFCG